MNSELLKTMVMNRKYIGLALMILGTALLVGLHLYHFTFINKLLLVPLLLILAGLLLHVRAIKKESAY